MATWCHKMNKQTKQSIKNTLTKNKNEVIAKNSLKLNNLYFNWKLYYQLTNLYRDPFISCCYNKNFNRIAVQPTSR